MSCNVTNTERLWNNPETPMQLMCNQKLTEHDFFCVCANLRNLQIGSGNTYFPLIYGIKHSLPEPILRFLKLTETQKSIPAVDWLLFLCFNINK